MRAFLSSNAGVLVAAVFLALSPLAPVDGLPRVQLRKLFARQAGGSAAACPRGSGVCVAMNLPTDAPKDIILKVTGPTKSGYTGIGFGPSMSNTLMLLLFPTKDGQLSASARLSTGHSRPGKNADPSIRVELLEGSAVTGDTFVANVRCTGCRAWSSGALQATAASSLIYATGSASGQGEQAVTSYHFFSRGGFKMDLTRAAGPAAVPASASP